MQKFSCYKSFVPIFGPFKVFAHSSILSQAAIYGHYSAVNAKTNDF